MRFELKGLCGYGFMHFRWSDSYSTPLVTRSANANIRVDVIRSATVILVRQIEIKSHFNK